MLAKERTVKVAGSFSSLLVLACLWCICLTNLARAQTQTIPPGPFVSDLSYGPNAGEVLNLCMPASDSSPHPGLIMIHGGGWRHENAGEMTVWCSRFAQMGFVVADIDYRLAPKQGVVQGWPTFQIGDVQLAIRWMQVNATQLNFDPKRLCAYGTSAGAYLAMSAGILHAILPSDVSSIYPTASVSLSCVVDAFGPVDLTDPHYMYGGLQTLVGVPYEEDPNIYQTDSPLFHVDAQTPPTMIIHGTHDRLVPISQSELLEKALQRYNVPTVFVTYDGDHAYQGITTDGLDNVFQKIAKFLNDEIGK